MTGFVPKRRHDFHVLRKEQLYDLLSAAYRQQLSSLVNDRMGPKYLLSGSGDDCGQL